MVQVVHNENDTGLNIQVDLAGAKKDTVQLDMGEAGFCVKGEAEDFKYETCYMLAHQVKPQEAEAKFDSGLLKIEVPFTEWMRSHKITVK